MIWSSGALILTAIVLGAWFFFFGKPSNNSLFPLNEKVPTILLVTPEDQSTYPADAAIPIQVSATSANPISRVELWINGQLVTEAQPGATSGQHFSHRFHWTPLEQGRARILVRGITEDGRIATSNPVEIQINEPAGAQLISLGADPENSEVILPILGDPALSLPQPTPPSYPVQSLAPAKALDSELSLWLGRQFSYNPTLPQAPVLTHASEGCQTVLVIEDRSNNELGFFLYRSGAGSSSFQRVAVLKNPGEGDLFSYIDPNQAPGAIYYAAAFNAAGESPTAPLMTSGLDPACSSTASEQASDNQLVEDLEILDLAYFYYAFDGGGYQRYPADSQVFLTPSEYPTSMRALAEGLAAASPALVKQADLVLWGWSSGALINLGRLQLEIDDTRLQVCNLGTGCTGDVASGFRSTYGELANDAEDQLREFTWNTTAGGTTAVLWQISTSPFSGDFSPHPPGLVAAGCSEGTQAGSFQVDFADLDAYLPAPSSCGSAPQPWISFTRFAWEEALIPGLEINYFIRIIPMAGNLTSGKPSNTVNILAKPGESYLEPVIVDHLPEIYQVEITDFTPIKNMDIRYWGCVFITGLNYNQIWDYYRSMYPASIQDDTINQIADKIYNDLNYAIENNLIVCPAPYQGSSDSGSVLSEWGSMFMEGLQELWDSVVTAFNSLKAEIVDQVATAINQLGIPCDQECRAGLRTGLEIGITYFTGIPPNLPSFEQLKEQGLEYVIEMAAAEAGIPCPAECQQILREGLEDVVDAAASNNSQPGCVGENWANVLGKHSLCLPPGVETAAVPEGVSEPARALIKISRTGQEPPGQYQYQGQPAYVLSVRFSAENSQLAGSSIPYTYSYLDWDKGYKEFFTVEAPVFTLQNEVFDSQSLPIPPLAPGESVTIPLVLTPHTYYIPEHLHSLMIELNARDLEIGDVGGIGGSRGAYFDWLCLHNGARIVVEASVSCLSVPSGLIGSTSPDADSELVPCGDPAIPFIFQEPSAVCYP